MDIRKKRPKYGPIGLRLHALIDWLLVLAGLTGPFVLGYAGDLAALGYTYLATFIGAGLNFITDYPGGGAKRLPMMWHQLIEWTAPVPFIVIPWMLFKPYASVTWLLTAIGIGIVANTMFTRKLKIIPVKG